MNAGEAVTLRSRSSTSSDHPSRMAPQTDPTSPEEDMRRTSGRGAEVHGVPGQSFVV